MALQLPRIHARAALVGVAALAVFLLAWVLRYNDPEGSYAGLTDDCRVWSSSAVSPATGSL
jgi:hypothetical protein